MNTATIPLTITPEAAERVAELGLQREFEQMLEHTRQTVSGLRSIVVELQPPYDTGDEPCLIIWANKDDPGPVLDGSENEWSAWKVATFPPEVCGAIVMMLGFGGGPDEG